MTGGSDSGSASRLTHARMLDALEAQVGLVRFALAGDGSAGSGSGAADVTAAVPSCPDWTVRDLVAHLGTVNWWAGQTVRDATPDARTRGMSAVQRSAPPAADGAAALADWYARIADEMLRTLTDTAPDRPPGPSPAPAAPTSGSGGSCTRPRSTAGTSRPHYTARPRRRPCRRTWPSTASTSSAR